MRWTNPSFVLLLLAAGAVITACTAGPRTQNPGPYITSAGAGMQAR